MNASHHGPHKDPRTLSRRRRPAHGLRTPTRPPDEQPLRAELFSVGQLERHAHTMAGWHELAPLTSGRYGPRGAARGADRLLTRLGENAKVFADAYTLLTEAVGRGRQITPAAEWFIDNYHLIDDQIRTARLHLPRSYSRELPRLVNAPIPGTPRAHELALELISHSHGRVDMDGLGLGLGLARPSSPPTRPASSSVSVSSGPSRSCCAWHSSRTCDGSSYR